MITNGYNALTGEPVNQQRRSLRHGKLWKLTHSSGGTFPYTELNDKSTVPSCFANEETNSLWYIRSSKSLKSQSSSTENGFAHDVDVGVEIPVGPAEVSAATTIKNSLMVGNSATSKRAFDQGTSQYEQSSYSRATRFSYSVGVDYDSVISWTDEFKYACGELGSQPSTSQVLGFFKNFGTHGILEATFGKECFSSTYLGSEQTLTSYKEFMSSTKTVGIEFIGLGFKGEEDEETLTKGDEKIKINYQFSNEECMGELKHDASCDGKVMKGNSVDSPIIVDYQVFPIWLMNVPTLSQGAKNKLESVFQDFMIASVNCADNHCNSHGACAPNFGAWYANTLSSNDTLDTFFDGSKCFCFDDFRDDGNERCAKGEAISVSTPSEFTTTFLNEWDGELNYMPNKRQPLCGMYSEHENFYEDRRFKLRQCNIDREWDGEQTTYTNRWDDEFLFQCDIDKVITGLHSKHHNDFEDRRWEVRCTHFKNTIVDEKSCVGIDIPRNEYDSVLEYTCPLGKVLHKFGGVHNNQYEDRRFSFDCCELMHYEDDDSLSTSDWSPYKNGYDGRLEVTAKLNGIDGAFSGISSIHHNFFEDRLFRFQVSVPPGNSKKLDSKPTQKNVWDGVQIGVCPDKDYVLTDIKSEHSNEHEDRRFEFECSKFDGMETNYCHATELVNNWDEEFNFSCGSQHVLTGMASFHSNEYEDRLFIFICCRWTKAREVEKLSLVTNVSKGFQLVCFYCIYTVFIFFITVVKSKLTSKSFFYFFIPFSFEVNNKIEINTGDCMRKNKNRNKKEKFSNMSDERDDGEKKVTPDNKTSKIVPDCKTYEPMENINNKAE